jgi:hypothetical protein
MKRLLSFSAIGSLLTAVLFLAVMPAWAEGVDDKIKSLEGELAQLKAQQIEMKKEATAAAEQLPTFSYRPGRGMTITAADKSWATSVSFRMNVHIYNHLDGRPNFTSNSTRSAGGTSSNNTGTTVFELFPRRTRFIANHCWANCFYEFEFSMDGESSPRTAQFRDQEIAFHFEQWNPWLPMFSVGLRRGAGQTHISRSSSSDAKLEHHMVLTGFDWGGDGSHAGAGLAWEDIDIGPGEYSLFINWASSKQGTHQEFVNSDRKGVLLFAGAKPFSKTKSKWIEGFEVGFGYQGQSTNNGDTTIRVRNHERRGRLELFRLGTSGTSGNVGDGWGQVFIPGVRWRVGPYMIRAVWFKTEFEGRNDGLRGVTGSGWNISNQLFVWSPKGLLTGSSSTPHSLLIGWDFERGDMDCGVGCDAAHFAGTFNSNTILNRELGVWYFIRRSFRVGAWWHWYEAKNTPVVTQVATGCKGDIVKANAGKGAGRECDWHSLNLGIQYHW